MSHEITNTDGLYLAVEPGWHGLSTVWPTAVGPAEAQKISGMGWRVEEEPIYLKRKDIVLGDDDLPVETVREIPVTSHKATVRADNGDVLGIVGDGYHVVQNADLVGLILDAAAKNVLMESAGTFRGGRDVLCSRVSGASRWASATRASPTPS